MRAALNTPIDAASAQIFLNVRARRSRGTRTIRLLLPRVDLTALFGCRRCPHAARSGEVRTSATVTRIDAVDDGSPWERSS